MSQSLRRVVLISALLLSCASLSLHAGTAAASAGEAQPQAGKTESPVAGLHAAASQYKSPDIVAPLVERAIRLSGNACKQLRDYQVYHVTAQGLTLKAKCAERPTYVLKVSAADAVQVSGGDGTIQPMNPQDGPITPVWGMRAEKYFSQQAKSVVAAKAPAAALGTPGKTTGSPALAAPLQDDDDLGMVLLAGLLLALLLALPLLAWLNARPSAAPGFTSHDKDMLVAESREILPSIYEHPDGWFIVRGRRGKRRVFRLLLCAYLYRNYGVKLWEVR